MSRKTPQLLLTTLQIHTHTRTATLAVSVALNHSQIVSLLQPNDSTSRIRFQVIGASDTGHCFLFCNLSLGCTVLRTQNCRCLNFILRPVISCANILYVCFNVLRCTEVVTAGGICHLTQWALLHSGKSSWSLVRLFPRTTVGTLAVLNWSSSYLF